MADFFQLSQRAAGSFGGYESFAASRCISFGRALETAQTALETAKTETQNLSGAVSGELKLLVLNNRGRVTECISHFTANYPKAVFNIRHDGKLNFRDFDLIITDKRIASEEYNEALFCREEILLAVPKNHPLAKEKCVSVSALAKEKFICMPRESNLGEYTHTAFSRVGILPEIAIECDDPGYILRYLKMGLGVSFFPSHSWESQADDHICLLKLEGNLRRDSYVYLRKNASVAARQFAKTLAE